MTEEISKQFIIKRFNVMYMLLMDDILTDLERCVIIRNNDRITVINPEIQTLYYDGVFESYLQVADEILTQYEEEGQYESLWRNEDLMLITQQLECLG